MSIFPIDNTERALLAVRFALDTYDAKRHKAVMSGQSEGAIGIIAAQTADLVLTLMRDRAYGISDADLTELFRRAQRPEGGSQ